MAFDDTNVMADASEPSRIEKRLPRLIFRFTNEVEGAMRTVAAIPPEVMGQIRVGDTVIVWDVPHVVTDVAEEKALCTCDPSTWKKTHGLR